DSPWTFSHQCAVTVLGRASSQQPSTIEVSRGQRAPGARVKRWGSGKRAGRGAPSVGIITGSLTGGGSGERAAVARDGMPRAPSRQGGAAVIHATERAARGAVF